jgi:anti-sigma B factor antagonist
MTITKKAEGSLLTIALAGRLDSATAPQLEAELGNDLTNVKDLIFDMADLEYLSSAGLRLLLSASKIMAKQGSMKLIHVNQSIKDVFEITGFSDILTIE